MADVKCSKCAHQSWRTETREDKVGMYCRVSCESQREGIDYQDCRLFVDREEANRWKAKS